MKHYEVQSYMHIFNIGYILMSNNYRLTLSESLATYLLQKYFINSKNLASLKFEKLTWGSL